MGEYGESANADRLRRAAAEIGFRIFWNSLENMRVGGRLGKILCIKDGYMCILFRNKSILKLKYYRCKISYIRLF